MISTSSFELSRGSQEKPKSSTPLQLYLQENCTCNGMYVNIMIIRKLSKIIKKDHD